MHASMSNLVPLCAAAREEGDEAEEEAVVTLLSDSERRVSKEERVDELEDATGLRSVPPPPAAAAAAAAARSGLRLGLAWPVLSSSKGWSSCSGGSGKGGSNMSVSSANSMSVLNE